MTVGPYATTKTFAWIKDNYSGKHVSLPTPFGIAKTDAFIMKLSRALQQAGPRVASRRSGDGRWTP